MQGNVMAVVTDKKIQHSSNNATVDYYEPDIVSVTDYAPFGMSMPGRKYQSNKYRYGYNGKENDNEVKGQGNQQDYGMRIYDPRLGRFLSVDPLIDKYPELSSYQYTNNSPIANIDLDGQEDYYYMLSFDAKTGKSQLTFNEKRDVGLWGIGNIFTSDCILEYPITIGGKEYTAEYYLTSRNTKPNQAALDTYNGKTKEEIAKILANTPTKWGKFAEGLKKDADDTEQRISEGFVIGAAIQRNNLIKQQSAANNKVSPSGKKNSTTNSGNQSSGGNNNQTSSQKAGALTNTGSAGSNAKTVTALDWSRVNKQGQNATDHVNLHGTNNTQKDFHGIFSIDPITQTNNAWNNKGNIQPVRQKNGNDMCIIPAPNAGTEGGV
jgi:RHS repeat-associated protein